MLKMYLEFIISLFFLVFFLVETTKSWKQFESERESVWRFITNLNNELRKKRTFSSLDILKSELEQSKVCM